MSRVYLAIALLVLARLAPGPARAFGGEGRARSFLRVCYANQLTLTGAVELRDLDKKTRSTVLDPALLAVLKAEGYLQTIPGDPGAGPDSPDHYVILPAPPPAVEVACLVHGRVRGDLARSAREQLEAGGLADPGLLARASTTPVAELHPQSPMAWITTGLWALVFVWPFTVLPYPLAGLASFGILFGIASLSVLALRLPVRLAHSLVDRVPDDPAPRA